MLVRACVRLGEHNSGWLCLCHLTGGKPRYHLSYAIVSCNAASLALHSMPRRRFVSSVVRHLAAPHNVATEPQDAHSIHGRSLSANYPHRE